MSCLRKSPALVALLCASLMLPATTSAAEPAAPSAEAAQQPAVVTVQDVALGADGYLEGVVVDERGATLAEVPVSVARGNQEVARTTTTKKGHFRVAGMRGGVYQITSSQGTGVYRLWSQDSAPPAARQLATVVAQPQVTRGQMPLGNFFRTETFILGAVVAAAIAIPVAIHNSRDDDDSGS